MAFHPTNWTAARWVTACLTAGYLGLFLELCYDHNHVVREHPVAWTPLVYSPVMLIVSGLCWIIWTRGWRTAFAWFSAAGLVVGAVGFWMHNGPDVVQSLGRMFSVWAGEHPDPLKRPPVLAPLAFAGLGLAGLVAVLAGAEVRAGPAEGQEPACPARADKTGD